MDVTLERENHPTVSDASAMRDFPDVRNIERDTLIDLVSLHPGMAIVDIQSAGGYLSDEVWRRLDGQAEIFCVEPSAALRSRLNPAFHAIDNPVEHFRSLGDGTIDVALGLAGLHHSHSHKATVEEAFRVLKPGGEVAICDVMEGSSLARWLNEFVSVHNPGGHEGNFPALGSMARLYEEAGFVAVREEVRDVPWIFARRADIAPFFRGLFGLELDVASIDAALDDYFEIAEGPDRCSVGWQLAYAHGRKPA